MGTEVTNSNEQLDGKVDGNKAGRNRTSDTSTSTTDTTAGRTDRGRVGTGSDGSRAGNETQKAEVPRLVTIESATDSEEQKRLERNARRRERYAKQKAENGGTVKPRKVNGTKKNDTQITTEQLDTFIVSLSTIIASRPNCEQWLLTKDEVQSITTPLMGILKDSEKLEIVTQNSNQIALAFACITVFAPRIFVTLQKQKAEREKVNNAKRKVTETKGNSKDFNKSDGGKPTTTNKEYGSGLSIYGNAVS